MDKAHIIFWLTTVVCSLAVYIGLSEMLEPFDSMVALDSSPSTSEVKGYYKALLLFADADFKGSAIKPMKLLGDIRNRLFSKRSFRGSLRAADILKNYPKWLVPLDTASTEAVPSTEEAVQAELRILSYLQTNFPQEPDMVSQTGSIVMHIINDFGARFVLEKDEKIVLKPDFLLVPLTRDWVNPTAGI